MNIGLGLLQAGHGRQEEQSGPGHFAPELKANCATVDHALSWSTRTAPRCDWIKRHADGCSETRQKRRTSAVQVVSVERFGSGAATLAIHPTFFEIMLVSRFVVPSRANNWAGQAAAPIGRVKYSVLLAGLSPLCVAVFASCTFAVMVGETPVESEFDSATEDPASDTGQGSDDESVESGISSGSTSTASTATPSDTTPEESSDDSVSTTDTFSTADSTSTTSSNELCDAPPPSECRSEGGVNALGMGCVLTAEITDSKYAYEGPLDASMTAENSYIGGYLPTNGTEYVVLSNGFVADLFLTPQELVDEDRCTPAITEPEFEDVIACPNHGIAGNDFEYGEKGPLFDAVDNNTDLDCYDDPNLVGQGDCSNSLINLVYDRQCPPNPGPAGGTCPGPLLKDFSELKLRIQVPSNVTSLSFDWVFLSAEYPFNTHASPIRYVDAFVAWLDSEKWTGNVSFGTNRQPISADSEFLTHFAESPAGDLPLQGSGFESHAGTPWMTTTFEVTPGEWITLYLALFDLGYDAFDSALILDNLRWGCETGRPTTFIR
jgi:hypothetical protein